MMVNTKFKDKDYLFKTSVGIGNNIIDCIFYDFNTQEFEQILELVK